MYSTYDTCDISELQFHWEVLKSINVVNDEIQEDFLYFDKGTNISDVWKWFEEKNPDWSVQKALSTGYGVNSYNIKDAPISVQRAFETVKSTFPEIDRVVFENDARWLYCNSDSSPDFEDQIDVDLLEQASDDLIEVPVIYYI